MEKGVRALEIARGLTPAKGSVQQSLKEAAELLRGGGEVLVTSHISPDGDAVGAALGLAHIVEALGGKPTVFFVDPIPFNLCFLEGASNVVHSLEPEARFDLTCVVDCASRARLGASFPENGWGKKVLVFDHHKSLFPDVDLEVHDVGASSIGELLLRLLVELGLAPSSACAQCCYTSIVSDTGGFRYSSTTTDAHVAAAAFLAAGVNVWSVSSNLFESNPLSRMRLLATVLNTLRLDAGGRLASIQITRAELSRCGAHIDMTDGFINFARGTRGVEVAVELVELDEKTWDVSFRSRGRLHVGDMARRLGGTGGRNAARLRHQGQVDVLLKRLAEILDEVDSEGE